MTEKTWQDLRQCVSGNAEFVSHWDQICGDMEKMERKWIQDLRAHGFKAAHPNDGWVNRETNEVVFTYPQFNDGAGIGDLVMIGWAGDKDQRPVRLIAQRRGFLLHWKFEDARGLSDD